MNSAAGAALIAGILSGVFVIVGVVLGAWLQSRSAERERARAASGQRDEVPAALTGVVNAVLAQAVLWHGAAQRARLIEPHGAALLRDLGKRPDPQLAGIEAEIERLRRDVISAVSEISVLVSRLGYIEPAMLASGERLGVAVRRLLAGIGASEGFETRLDEVRQATYALRRKRDELAEQDRPQGWWARRRQQREGQRGDQAAGPADAGPPDGKREAS